MTLAVTGKGTGITLLMMRPITQAGILEINNKTCTNVPRMPSGTTEPSKGLILNCSVSSINTNPIVPAIQKDLSLKKFFMNLDLIDVTLK